MFFCKYREIVKNISGGCFNRYLDPIKDHRKDIAGVRTNPSLHQSINSTCKTPLTWNLHFLDFAKYFTVTIIVENYNYYRNKGVYKSNHIF